MRVFCLGWYEKALGRQAFLNQFVYQETMLCHFYHQSMLHRAALNALRHLDLVGDENGIPQTNF